MNNVGNSKVVNYFQHRPNAESNCWMLDFMDGSEPRSSRPPVLYVPVQCTNGVTVIVVATQTQPEFFFGRAAAREEQTATTKISDHSCLISTYRRESTHHKNRITMADSDVLPAPAQLEAQLGKCKSVRPSTYYKSRVKTAAVSVYVIMFILVRSLNI